MIAMFISILGASASMLAAGYNIWLTSKNNLLKQASKISIWYKQLNFVGRKNDVGNSLYNKYVVSNDSNSPIYNVFIIQHSNNNHNYGVDSFLDALGDRIFANTSHIEILPPGKQEIILESNGNAMAGEHDVASVLFTDIKNVQWFRHANGVLEKKDYINLLVRRSLIMKHV